MTPKEFEFNVVIIGENALNELLAAIEKTYYPNEDEDIGRIKACDLVALGIKAVIDHTNADVTKVTSNDILSFRDCEGLADMVELLEFHDGAVCVEFHGDVGDHPLNKSEEVTI